MATREEIATLVIKQMNTIGWKSRTPSTDTRAYAETCEAYFASLAPFSPEILKAAVAALRDSHAYAHWPLPALLVSTAAREEAKHRKPVHKALPPPRYSAEHQAEMRGKLGKLYRAMQEPGWGQDEDADWQAVYGGER